MALNPTDLFDIRSLLTEEERMIQDAVARFTDEKVIPIIGDAFDQGRFPNWFLKSPIWAFWAHPCRRNTAAPA